MTERDGEPRVQLYDTARRRGGRPSSRDRWSRCTRAASRPTTPPTSATPQVYLTFDVLQRRLRDLGHETRCVRNVTDVDDDILRKARELGVHYLDLAAEEIARFDADMAALGLLPAWSEPRATSAIAEILTLIGAVLESGHAYQAGGAVYFDVTTFDVRPGQPLRPADHAGPGRRARRQSRRPEQAPPARLRPLAAVAARRAVVGVAVGAGPTRVAHRVLGPGPARARARPSTSTAAAATSSSPTTSARRPSPSRSPDGPSSGTGSTWAWSAWTARRCPSPSATWSSSATC